MLISIIMASYNCEKYLYDSIQSVLKQTYKNFELIIVDDKSTDSSLSIAKNFAKLDKRISVYSNKKNLGASYSRNFAIKKSQGDWIAILDADDLYHPEKLEIQVNFIKNNPSKNIVLVGTGCNLIDNKGIFLGNYAYPTSSDSLKRNLFLFKKFPPHSSLIYLASKIKKAGLFDINFDRAEDFNLWLALSELGDFGCINQCLTYYRVHMLNKSRNQSKLGFFHYEFAISAQILFYISRKYGFSYITSKKKRCLNDTLLFIKLKLQEDKILDFFIYRDKLHNVIAYKNKPHQALLISKFFILDPFNFMILVKHNLFGSDIGCRFTKYFLKEKVFLHKYFVKNK